jgi:hypothetical protein
VSARPNRPLQLPRGCQALRRSGRTLLPDLERTASYSGLVESTAPWSEASHDDDHDRALR